MNRAELHGIMKYEVLGSPPWHWASQCILILCECDESRDTNINIYNNLFDWSETLQTQSEEHIAASVTDCWQRRPRVKSLCRLHSSGRHRLANVQVVTRAMWGGYLTGRQSASSCAKTKLYRWWTGLPSITMPGIHQCSGASSLSMTPWLRCV